VNVIKLEHPHYLTELPALVCALGYFDGVHLGHQKVIMEAKEKAEELGMKSAVMTFDPHPSVVLGKDIKHIRYISPMEDKILLFKELGIDYVFIVEFSLEFAHLLPQEFIDQYIIGLNIKHVVAGFDFTYGKMGKGTMETIPFHSRSEFSYSVISKLTDKGQKISSTFIRRLITEGKMEVLPSLLGRYYQTSGKVIHGDKRGRTIGFPTANVELNGDYLLPPLGVYAVRFKVKGQWFFGVCNVGYKPTFKLVNDGLPSIEVHIFDFNQDIYGQDVAIEWHSYLRIEQKFNGISELVDQINKDKENALAYFENNDIFEKKHS
jgi:riboflavin kinase / FMN adenylyltransferase